LLNVYGYGLCDDIARVSECLYRSAGMKSRIWDIGGHVVTEAFYNRLWHVLDADHRVFYLLRDMRTIAGMNECATSGSSVARVSGDEIAGLYLSRKDNGIGRDQWDAANTMRMRLRPGESLERFHANWGKYHDLSGNAEPPDYGNGLHRFDPDLQAETGKRAFSSLQNVEVGQGSRKGIRLIPGANLGSAVVEMQCPYVYVGGEVTVKGTVADSGSEVRVLFSRDGMVWRNAGMMGKGSQRERRFSLDRHVAPTSSPACYRFFVGFEILSPSANPKTVIEEFSIAAEVQCAPNSLPGLVPGRVNSLAVLFEPVPGASLEVEAAWRENAGCDMTASASAPVQPRNGETVQTTTPTLVWTSVAADAPHVWREVVVSWDPDGLRPVSPVLMHRGPGPNRWQVPEGWLLKGQTYYWRVREFSPSNPWSDAWSFRTEGVPLRIQPRKAR
jgi:hypothetical protein